MQTAQPLIAATHPLPLPQGGSRIIATSDTVRGKGPGRALIMGFHGGSGDARRFAARSGLAEAFAPHGETPVFPQAVSHWADGRPSLEAGWAQDRAFVDEMIAAQSRALDRQDGPLPVAAVGGSNGGMFALRLACEMDPPLRAAVAVAASMPAAYAARAARGRPVPVMLVQATQDRMIPWAGGQVPQLAGISVPGTLLAADDVVEFWLARNGCTGAPRHKTAAIGPHEVEIFAWTGPADGADVWRVVLRGAGHRLLDRSPGARLRGSLEELIAQFVIWHLDPARLAPVRQ